MWVSDTGDPLPYKYVVTDRGIPGLLSFTTVMSDWDTAPDAPDSLFVFEAPRGAKRITFMPIVTSGAAR